MHCFFDHKNDSCCQNEPFAVEVAFSNGHFAIRKLGYEHLKKIYHIHCTHYTGHWLKKHFVVVTALNRLCHGKKRLETQALKEKVVFLRYLIRTFALSETTC